MATTFTRSDQQPNSRYKTGGISTIVGDRIGWWERTIYPTSPSDIPFVITQQYAQRPDLLAFDVYGKAGLQWFILQYNSISDIYTDFVAGATILLPTSSRLFGEILSKS